MADDRTYLDKIYRQDAAGAARLYGEWAPSYDAELTANGYQSPQRVAAALRAAGAEPSAPVLDYGCGTGLSGQALADAGFIVVDGWDPCDAMLAQARAKGCYRTLTRIDPDASLPDARYAAIAAIGVIVPAHAPPQTLAALLARLPSGGLLAWSYNPAALADPAYVAAAEALTAEGDATLVSREEGVHIAALDAVSAVFVVRRN